MIHSSRNKDPYMWHGCRNRCTGTYMSLKNPRDTATHVNGEF